MMNEVPAVTEVPNVAEPNSRRVEPEMLRMTAMGSEGDGDDDDGDGGNGDGGDGDGDERRFLFPKDTLSGPMHPNAPTPVLLLAGEPSQLPRASPRGCWRVSPRSCHG